MAHQKETTNNTNTHTSANKTQATTTDLGL